MKIKKIIFSIITIALLNLLINPLITNHGIAEENANTLYVGSAETYKTIQSAIDAANDKDTIYIYNGIYNENLIIDKPITLTGEDTGNTIVKGVNKDTVINITATDVTITNLEITGNIIDENNRSYAGIYLINSNIISITNCNILDCQVAMRIWKSTDITVSSCNITNNIGGINPWNSSYVNITYSGVSTNKLYGVSIINSSYIHIFYSNIIDNNGSGIAMSYSQNNRISYNLIKNNSGYGFVIYKSSKKINESTIPEDQSDETNDSEFRGRQLFEVIDLPSLGNTIHENNFIENENNAFDGYNNSWDTGIIGNYWDDYYGEDWDNDNIGDIPYLFFGNQDNYPIMTPLEYAGGLNITLPKVEILTPLNGSPVNGTIIITGVSSHPDGEIQEVLVKMLGDYEWNKANGTTNWNYTLNTISYDNGEYKIFARATDGKSYSPLSQITLIVSNPILKEETKDTESTPGFELILIILSLIILLISYQKTRKNNKR